MIRSQFDYLYVPKWPGGDLTWYQTNQPSPFFQLSMPDALDLWFKKIALDMNEGKKKSKKYNIVVMSYEYQDIGMITGTKDSKVYTVTEQCYKYVHLNIFSM